MSPRIVGLNKVIRLSHGIRGAVGMLAGVTRAWKHAVWSTYGTWLPGDPRGFRDHDHRVHSSGDYRRRPPPGEHAGLRRFARERMTREPVRLGTRTRDAVLDAVLQKIVSMDLEVLAVCVSATHAHLLADFGHRDAVREVGRIKRAVSLKLRDRFPGGMWSKRCHLESVRSREHQGEVFRYIVEHGRREHASVWTFRENGGSE